MIEFLCYTCIGLCILLIIMTLSEAQARSKLDRQQKRADRQSQQQKGVLELINVLTSERFVGGQVMRRVGPSPPVFWRSHINNIQGGPDGLKLSIEWSAQLQGNKWVYIDPSDMISPFDITQLENYTITCIDEECVTINRGDGDVVITFYPADSSELLDPAKIEKPQTEPAETVEPTEPAEPAPPDAPDAKTPIQISEQMLEIIKRIAAKGKGKLWGVGSLQEALSSKWKVSRQQAEEFLKELETLGVLGSFVKCKGRASIMDTELLQTLLDLKTWEVIKAEPEPTKPADTGKPVISNNCKQVLEAIRNKETLSNTDGKQLSKSLNIEKPDWDAIHQQLAGLGVLYKEHDGGPWKVNKDKVAELLKQVSKD